MADYTISKIEFSEFNGQRLVEFTLAPVDRSSLTRTATYNLATKSWSGGIDGPPNIYPMCEDAVDERPVRFFGDLGIADLPTDAGDD